MCLQSVLCCPVLGPKGATLAVIQAFHAKEHYFSDRHVTMVQQLAKMAAIALQNQSLLLAKAGDLLVFFPQPFRTLCLCLFVMCIESTP